jgi:hypothetical protein
MGSPIWIMVVALRAFAYPLGDGAAAQDPEPTESQPTDAPSEVPIEPAADGASVALEPVRFPDQSDERIAAAFDAALRERLGGSMTLMPACTAEPCDYGSTQRIRVEVRERERDYAMNISIVDAQGNVGATRSIDCTVCTPTEAANAAAITVNELMAPPPVSDEATVRVDSSPSSAEVWLDGARVGTTPTEVKTTPGAHTIELRLKGHYNKARELELAPGAEESIRLELARDRGDTRSKQMRIAGWTLIGVGVAALIGGITLMAIDENPIKSDCSGSHVDSFGNCAYRWNTMAGGATLLVGGLASAGAGTALVVIGSSKRRAELRGGPTHASITVRF